MKKQLFLLALIFASGLTAIAQSNKEIEVTGTIVGDESMEPLPFAYIIVDSTGTTTNLYGHYSITVHKLDTIQFSYVGYKKKQFIIPASLTTNTLKVDIILVKDITFLKNVIVRSLPETLDDFKEELLSTELPDSENLTNAQKSIDIATYQSLYMSSFKLSMSAYDNYSMFMKGNEGLNPAGGNIKGLLKFLKNRAEGKPLEGTYNHYKYYQKNKGQ